jgi:hypothetical protein
MVDIEQREPAKKAELAWHRHPALIAVIGAVLTVIGSALTIGLGQAGALPEQLNPAPAPVTVSATETVTATTTVTPPVDSTTTPAGSIGPGQVVWQRKVQIPYQSGVDVDEAQPVVLPLPEPEVEFRTSTHGDGRPNLSHSRRTLAGSASSVTPTYDQCVDAVSTAAVGESFPTPVGKTFCFREVDEVAPRIASVRILAWSKEDWRMEAEVTVWILE